MKRILLLICLPGLILTIPGFTLAEEVKRGAEIVKLQQVIVTAPRIDKTLVETPASVTIITAEEIEGMGAKNIIDIVRNIPGVVEDAGQRLKIRGNRTDQAGGPLVLVNGVPANEGLSNYVEYDAISISDIERIEIVRSSASIAFGPDASRGVINIITKRGKDGPPKIQLGTTYGSWNTSKAWAGITGRIKNLDYGFNGSFFDTDSYRDDKEQRKTARTVIGYNFDDDTRLGFNLAWQKADYDYIYDFKSEWLLDNYRRSSIFPTSPTNDTLIHYREYDNENLTTSLDFEHKSEVLFVNALVSYDNTDQLYENLKQKLNPLYDKTNKYYDFREDRNHDRFMARASGGCHFYFSEITYTPTIGMDYEKTEYNQTRTYPWSPAPYSTSQKDTIELENFDGERERWGFFLNNEINITRQWELNFSGRVDDVEYDCKNQGHKQITKNHTDYSWNVTPAFHPTTNSTIYASASQSYWYPVLYYYKCAMKYGDVAPYRPENLKPEESLTYEVGYKHYFGSKLSLAMVGYFMEIKDKCYSYYDETNTWRGYFNAGTSEHLGFELEASGRLCPFFGYRVSGAYQQAKWDEGMFRAYLWGATQAEDDYDRHSIDGKKLVQLPDFTGTFGLDFYFLEHFKVSTDINYYGERYVDMLNQYKSDDYATVDAMLSYTRGIFKIWVLGSNLLNREEEMRTNASGKRNAVGSPAGPTDDRYFPIEGRYMEAGITFSF